MESQRCCFNAPLRTNSTNQSSTIILTEDVIVAEILPRLHVKSLFRFKCVSVRYESIISDGKFGQKYVQRAYSSQESCSSSGLLAFLLFPVMNEIKLDAFTANVKDLSEIVNSSSHNQYADDEDKLSICLFTASLSCDHTDHYILGSSGGLQLSTAGLEHTEYRDRHLCVSNPLTKQCVRLPKRLTTDAEEFFGFTTRWDDAAASLTYKVVIILDDCGYGPQTIEVFSSDTGSWVVGKVNVRDSFFSGTTPELCYSYKGVLHWLDRKERSVITYNPYDTPHQTHSFNLPEPEGKYSVSNGSLIYSGEEEVLKYCEIGKCESEPDVDRLMVWSLEEGKWCLEGEFSVPLSLLNAFRRFMVAPCPWNRRVICHPHVYSNTITVLNPWDGTWKLVDIYKKSDVPLFIPFYPAELRPWSSPLYAAASLTILF